MRALALIATLIVVTDSARAAEIHALITTAMKAAIDELVPNFEREWDPLESTCRHASLSIL